MAKTDDTAHLHPFEDIIDGYFPLQVSLQQMLSRLGARLAFVEITHAPIMQFPDLPHYAPVPLNIRAGRAGIIETLLLRVDVGGAVSGKGNWRWLDGSDAENVLDPMTRLAEPAYLWGLSTASAPNTRALKTQLDISDWGPLATNGSSLIERPLNPSIRSDG